MLSPNDAKRVTLTRGGASTETLNEHTSFRWRASVAVHVTFVEPTGNIAPLAGLQTIETGGAPPVAVGVPYWMAVAWQSRELNASVVDGQSTCGPSGYGSTGGALGLAGLAHADVASASHSTRGKRLNKIN